MRNFVNKVYNLKIDTVLKKSENIFYLYSKDESYVLKFIDNNLELIYLKIEELNLDAFFLPIKSKNNNYVESYNNKLVIISKFIKEEDSRFHESKQSFYIHSIAHLHVKSAIGIKKEDHYKEEVIAYFNDELNKIEEELLSRIAKVEKEEYHSLSDWYFLLNYRVFYSTFKVCEKAVKEFEDAWNDELEHRIHFTYQNFNYRHIFLKTSKIISLEKMSYSSCVIDLYDFISKFDDPQKSIIPYIKDYLSINPLKNYEKAWLKALLTIINFETKSDEIEKLASLIDINKNIVRNQEIISLLYENES